MFRPELSNRKPNKVCGGLGRIERFKNKYGGNTIGKSNIKKPFQKVNCKLYIWRTDTLGETTGIFSMDCNIRSLIKRKTNSCNHPFKIFFGRSIVNKRSRNVADCPPTGYQSATDGLPTGYRPFAKTKSLLQNRHKWSIIPGQEKKMCFKTRKQLAIFLCTSLPIDCWDISYGS